MKKWLLSNLVLLFGLFSINSFAQTIPVVAGMDLVGIVKTNSGTILPNVVVTDGYTTTQTNAQGIYYLKKNAYAKFVYMSTPAGYTAPLDKSVPQFYAKIYPTTKVQRNDFEVVPNGVNDNKHVYVVLADPQPQTEREAIRFRTETIADLKGLASTLSVPLHVGAAGDICWDAPLVWPHYKRSCASVSGIPFYNAPGNHDHNLCYSDQNVSTFPSINQYEKFFGPSYYSYNRGSVHYVNLDDIDYKSGPTSSSSYDKTYNSKLPQRQIDWLIKDLAYVPKSTLIVITLHIATKRRYSSTPALSNYAAFYAALSGYKGYIMSGHHHTNSIATTYPNYCTNFTEINMASVHGQFWDCDKLNNNAPITICPDGSRYGYGVFTFEGNVAVDWYWKGVGVTRDFQMQLYKKGELYAANSTVSTFNGKVGANIFFWDDAWTVKYYEDGVYKGLMSRYGSRVYDPIAKNLLQSTHLKYHSSAGVLSGVNNDHMFYYTPTATARMFKVVATDRWGKVYKDSCLIN